MRTQVAIVGAGPAGLMLGHLLHLRGIDSVILENRSRDYVVERVRAGVLEQGTVDLMTATGVGDRLRAKACGTTASTSPSTAAVIGSTWRDLTGGRAITIYGQNEVVKDLIDARLRHRASAAVRGGDVSSEPSRRGAPVDSFTTGRRAARAVVRLRRRLRRLPRRVPDGHSAVTAARSTSASIRSDGSGFWPAPRRRRTSSSTAITSRLRAVQHAVAAGDAALSAVRARRGSRRLARRAHLGGAHRQRLSTDDGWRPNEGEIFQKA